jgi:hypothetical protein
MRAAAARCCENTDVLQHEDQPARRRPGQRERVQHFYRRELEKEAHGRRARCVRPKECASGVAVPDARVGTGRIVGGE